ncbi:hypothetical protein ACHAXT_003085 [Thalassiosira profunda]
MPPSSSASTVHLPASVHALGGSLGSALAILAFYPLERIRVELQSHGAGKDDSSDEGSEGEDWIKIESPGQNQKHRASHETILQCLLRLHKEQTLYKGASHMATTLMVSNAIFFYALQATRRSLASLEQNGRRRSPLVPKSSMGKSLLASSLAGAINVLLSNPLWVASLRIMESKLPDDVLRKRRPTLWNIMHRIARDEGVSQLWNGTRTSLLLVSNPIIQHFCYDRLRLLLLEGRRKRVARGRDARVPTIATLSPVEAFILGALAKTVATVLTYPLQLAQVLLRLQRKSISSPERSSEGSDKEAYTGTLDCLCQQFSREGIPGLFQGMNAKLIQTVSTAAFTFLTYEQTLTQVARIYGIVGAHHKR